MAEVLCHVMNVGGKLRAVSGSLYRNYTLPYFQGYSSILIIHNYI